MLAAFVIVIHLAWIVFLAVGFIFVVRRSRIAYVHAAGLLFSLILNVFGWYCPLTYLEGYLHRTNAAGPIRKDPLLVRVLEGVVYPDLPENLIRGGEIGFVLLNAAGYGWVLGRAYSRRRKGSQRVDGG
ncbi:MAG: DUF2784 family protein [Thermodesulfobacteriota bacterium]